MNNSVTGSERQIATWLLICCAILFALIVLGGVTRLTGSGLSITDWRPVTGVLPPFTEQGWQQEFDLYRASPEYQQVNRGMSMSEFKVIYGYEYAHRLLARLLGIVFAIPLAWFWFRGRIPPRLRWPLLGILGLGALQGYMGWFMVASGLVDIPRVSPYRLAAHLGLALLIYAAMFWVALGLLRPRTAFAPAAPPREARGLQLLLLTVAITIMSGAFVAGLKAGMVYNTFPLMAGQWVPDGLLHLEPVWRNWFENPATVQFTHRLLGIGTVVLVLFLWARAWALKLTATQRFALHGLAAMALVQAALGIKTLLLFVPVSLGAAHQGGAVILLSLALFALYEMGGAREAVREPAPVGARIA
jgi:heme a synthase